MPTGSSGPSSAGDFSAWWIEPGRTFAQVPADHDLSSRRTP